MNTSLFAVFNIWKKKCLCMCFVLLSQYIYCSVFCRRGMHKAGGLQCDPIWGELYLVGRLALIYIFALSQTNECSCSSWSKALQQISLLFLQLNDAWLPSHHDLHAHCPLLFLHDSLSCMDTTSIVSCIREASFCHMSVQFCIFFNRKKEESHFHITNIHYRYLVKIL